MRCEAKQCDKLRYNAIAMSCGSGARWDALRGRVLGAKRAPGSLGQQRAPGRLRRARSTGAAASCLSELREVVGVWGDGWRMIGARLGARGRSLGGAG